MPFTQLQFLTTFGQSFFSKYCFFSLTPSFSLVDYSEMIQRHPPWQIPSLPQFHPLIPISTKLAPGEERAMAPGQCETQKKIVRGMDCLAVGSRSGEFCAELWSTVRILMDGKDLLGRGQQTPEASCVFACGGSGDAGVSPISALSWFLKMFPC